jgi:hypothetical protein
MSTFQWFDRGSSNSIAAVSTKIEGSSLVRSILAGGQALGVPGCRVDQAGCAAGLSVITKRAPPPGRSAKRWCVAMQFSRNSSDEF